MGLMLLSKFIPNKTKEMHFLRHFRRLVEIRYHKGTGTKMHNCLVGIKRTIYIYCIFVTKFVVKSQGLSFSGIYQMLVLKLSSIQT